MPLVVVDKIAPTNHQVLLPGRHNPLPSIKTTTPVRATLSCSLPYHVTGSLRDVAAPTPQEGATCPSSNGGTVIRYLILPFIVHLGFLVVRHLKALIFHLFQMEN